MTRTSTEYPIDGMKIPTLGSEIDTARYLEHDVAAPGIRRPNMANVLIWFGRLRGSPLKPDQNVGLLKYILLPIRFVDPKDNERETEGDR